MSHSTHFTDEFAIFFTKVDEALADANLNATAVQVLSLADALFVPAPVPESAHDALVRQALEDAGSYYGGILPSHDGFGGEYTTVSQWAFAGKKIHAIKRLRWLTSCGLKEAREAVEDYRFIRGYM